MHMPVAVAQGSVQMGTATWLSCWLCATDTNTTRTVPCRRHSFLIMFAPSVRETNCFVSSLRHASPCHEREFDACCSSSSSLCSSLSDCAWALPATEHGAGLWGLLPEEVSRLQTKASDMGPQGTPTARRLDKPAMRQPAVGTQLSQHQTPGCSKRQVTDVSPSDPAPPLCTWAQLIESILSSCSPSKLAMLQSTCRFFRQSAVIERIAKQSLKSVPRARSLKPSARCGQYTCTFPCPSPDNGVTLSCSAASC